MTNTEGWDELTGQRPAEQGGQRPERRRSAAAREDRGAKRRRSLVVLGVLLAALVGVGVLVWPVVSQTISSFSAPAAEDYSTSDATGDTVRVTVPAGATGTEIAQILHEEDVIASERAFVDVAANNPDAGGIQPGAYEVGLRIPAADALAALLDPASRQQVIITIPEGFTINQVIERVAAATGEDVTTVQQVTEDPEALGLPEQAQGSAEGWFAPATYTFDDEESVETMLSTMVTHTVQRLQELGVPQDRWDEILTKASIIEREVAMPEYFTMVARVLDNRLEGASETVGRLQMDSTVLYGVGKSGGIPTREDLADDNPYNSYLYAGLPPTPIGSPGAEAITAAMNPEPGDWLYFVTVDLNTGETKFATTLEEHQQYVQELREWRDSQG